MSQGAERQKLAENQMVAQLPQLTVDLYREIFVHSYDAIAIISPQGHYIEQNGAHYQLLGYSDAELDGQTPAIHLGAETFARIASELTENGTYHGEVVSRTKDGSEKHLDLSAFAMRNSVGEPLCYIGIKRDITGRKLADEARRRAKQRLELQYAVTRVLSESSDFAATTRHLLQTICECLEWDVGAMWLLDHQANTLYCVDFWHTPTSKVGDFETISRVMRLQKGIGLPGRIWASGDPAWIPNALEDPNFPRAQAAAKAGLHSAFGFPILIGREVLGAVEFLNREIRQPDEDLLKVAQGLGGQIGQFNERVRAERELAVLLGSEQAARADAEHANRLKDEFLATLSHELRTPLNAVIGWSKMLRSGRLDGDSSHHALEVIERNAWAQQQIIEDILDVSRVVTGKLQLNLGPVRIEPVVEAALDSVRPALQAKGINIETSIQQNLNIISGDADRLQQVVWNLLSNASKFTPAGGSVKVDVAEHDSQLQISVEDSGPGIPGEFLPHVFERFRQADGSTTRTHGGLGLGLAIVRHLVELHGGTIAARNRTAAGNGAIFVITLPLPTSELRIDDASNNTILRVAAGVSLEGLRILVVDDEIDALDLITIELSQHGANVKAVRSGAEALLALSVSDYDVLIADIGMPEMDGYQLIRRVRNQETVGKRIPAVALTAYARVQDRMRAVLAGYNTHAAKPIESNELLTVVASLAGRFDNN